ncbi:hypothetical protein EDC04DRAFT_2677295 [Pisolithus marmoratus]|nr:hypothetical protein EDC04DRAFT_2677295 [Pisolithus marmoratus]
MGCAMVPTAFLPPLVHLDDYTPCQVLQSMHTLKRLYFPRSISSQPSSARALSQQTGIIPELREIPTRCADILMSRSALGRNRSTERRGQHTLTIEEVPDSGYASAEEDAKCTVEKDDHSNEEDGEAVCLELLRADDLERGFAIKWLTGFLKRADSWMTAWSIGFLIDDEALGGGSEKAEGIEGDICAELIDEASALLVHIAGYDEDDDNSRDAAALTRQFCFPFNRPPRTACAPLLGGCVLQSDDTHSADTIADQEFITVELNDAPLDTVDHTAVGLQSWASAIILAKRMCAHSRRYLFPNNLNMSTAHPSREPPLVTKMRVLELGAGTGLLSIVAAQLYRKLGCSAHVKATDYHPMVLENLTQNLRSNLGPVTCLSSYTHEMASLQEVNVDVEKLDWSSAPEIEAEAKYDIVLAADVIYDPRHARWVCDCVMKTLKKPMQRIGEGGGVFWLAMPLRSTGRHEGMERTVEDAFPVLDGLEEGRKDVHRLVVVSREELGRQEGVGRADEGGYTLFEVRWA